MISCACAHVEVHVWQPNNFHQLRVRVSVKEHVRTCVRARMSAYLSENWSARMLNMTCQTTCQINMSDICHVKISNVLDDMSDENFKIHVK